jgi:hypothetical protein
MNHEIEEITHSRSHFLETKTVDGKRHIKVYYVEW